ncbi:MAG: hypothetical protein JTT11_09875 [Candidatus Brockarchaeota archaeon]|nr:hypothetical protein [Candidatus Brockarchaeota archaeon]
MVSVKNLLEPYALRRKTHTRYYVALLTVTTTLLVFSIVLDYAQSGLATPLIQSGALAFLATLLLGVAERSPLREGTKEEVLFSILDAFGATSISVLPFFVASVAVLFYLGSPSSQAFFYSLKLVITVLGILAAIPLLCKVVFLQMPILYQQLRGSRAYSFLFYAATFSILAAGAISYRFATYLLDESLLTWYMYMTFLFFLELLFLYLSAEAAYWQNKDYLLFSLISYAGITTFSTLGILEAAKLTFYDYSNVFPKIVTGLVLLGANTGIMDNRLSAMALEASKGERAAPPDYASPRLMSELAETIERMQSELKMNRILIERQQAALQRLYDLTGKTLAQQSDDVLDSIREEIRELREVTMKTVKDPVEELFVSIRDALLKHDFDQVQLKKFVGFLAGPMVPEPLLLQGKRYRDISEISPFPLLLLFYVALTELETGRKVETLKKVGLASFLIRQHPKFKGSWAKRTAQDFLSDVFAGYIKPHRAQADLILREEKGEEFLRTDGVAGRILKGLKEFAESTGAEKDANSALYGLKRVAERLRVEFEVPPEDVAQYEPYLNK